MANIDGVLAEIGARLRKLERRGTGGVSPIVSVSTSQTLKAANQTVLASASGGNRTLTLPAAADARYVVITVKKTDASANTVTLDANGAETIDGAATHTLTAQYDAVTIWCSGVSWYIIGENTNAGTAPTTAAYVLGQATYDGTLSAEIPVPRYGYHPDKKPSSAGSLDDEFESGPTGWTWINQGASTAAVAGSWLELTAEWAATDNLRALVKTAPSTPWTVTALIFPQCAAYANYVMAGLCVRETSSGKLYFLSHSYFDDPDRIEVTRWNSATSWNSAAYNSRQGYWGGYFRITDDGTDVTFHFSPYPNGTHFVELLSLARGEFFTTGPDQVGICGKGTGGSVDMVVLCDWFRET